MYSYLNLFFQTFIFDFDGTLYLSNEIKKEGFFHCASPFPNGKNIMDYALNNLNKKIGIQSLDFLPMKFQIKN